MEREKNRINQQTNEEQYNEWLFELDFKLCNSQAQQKKNSAQLNQIIFISHFRDKDAKIRANRISLSKNSISKA